MVSTFLMRDCNSDVLCSNTHLTLCMVETAVVDPTLNADMSGMGRNFIDLLLTYRRTNTVPKKDRIAWT